MKLLIIGAGGVGSYLARSIYEYKYNNQLPALDITIADGDSVDIKNLTYQNFTPDDILENKAEAIGSKYNFKFIPEYITKDFLIKNDYDIIVCAVDGTKFRKDLYNYVFDINTKVFWLDLRSVGSIVSIYRKSKLNTKEYMLSTIPSKDVENGSCQLQFELNNGIVQGGNRIIAEIGGQFVLSWYRGKSDLLPHKFIYNF